MATRRDNGRVLSTEQHFQQREYLIMDHVLTDLLAARELDADKDERIQQLIVSRLDNE